MGLQSLVRRGWGRICQSRSLARRIFGVDFPPLPPGGRYFDLTTAALVCVAARALARAGGCSTWARAPSRRSASRSGGAAPYVPSRLLPGPGDVQSDGGPEGTSVIEGFLDAFAARGTRATAYLGVNRLFVPREKVLSLVARRPGLVLEQIRRRWPLPVDVYVLVRR